MLRTLLILSFVSYATGCTPGEFSYLESGAVPSYDPSLSTQLVAATAAQCGAHEDWNDGQNGNDAGDSKTYSGSTDPKGCILWQGDLYWNTASTSTTECRSADKCLVKCYTNGCNDPRATNYDEHAYEAKGCVAPAPPSGVVKTCDSTRLVDSGYTDLSSAWCNGDTDANGAEYYVIEKADGHDCAFVVPDGGEIDLSVIQTDKPIYIAHYAFDGCSALTSIILHESTEVIGKYAFSNTGLTSINLKSVSRVQMVAFSNTQMNTVTINGPIQIRSNSFPDPVNYDVGGGGGGIDATDCIALGDAYSTQGCDTINAVSATDCIALRDAYNTQSCCGN